MGAGVIVPELMLVVVVSGLKIVVVLDVDTKAWLEDWELVLRNEVDRELELDSLVNMDKVAFGAKACAPLLATKSRRSCTKGFP